MYTHIEFHVHTYFWCRMCFCASYAPHVHTHERRDSRSCVECVLYGICIETPKHVTPLKCTHIPARLDHRCPPSHKRHQIITRSTGSWDIYFDIYIHIYAYLTQKGVISHIYTAPWEFQTKLLHYFFLSNNKSNLHFEHTYECVTSHIYAHAPAGRGRRCLRSHKASHCHTEEWVMSHMWI